MSSELVYRMRTCAAALLLSDDISLLHRDASDLLVEAANLLDEPEDLGEPMAILKSEPAHPTQQGASWGTLTLPTQPFDFGAHNPRPCPSCGSVDVRKVRIENKRLMLICPVCAHRWEFVR